MKAKIKNRNHRAPCARTCAKTPLAAGRAFGEGCTRVGARRQSAPLAVRTRAVVAAALAAAVTPRLAAPDPLAVLLAVVRAVAIASAAAIGLAVAVGRPRAVQTRICAVAPFAQVFHNGATPRPDTVCYAIVCVPIVARATLIPLVLPVRNIGAIQASIAAVAYPAQIEQRAPIHDASAIFLSWSWCGDWCWAVSWAAAWARCRRARGAP